MEFSTKFIKAALIRAIKTAAQVSLGMITIGAAFNEIDWAMVGSVAGVSAIYSILTSIVGGVPEAKNDGNLVISDGEEKQTLRFEINKPIEDIKEGDSFLLQVTSSEPFKDGDE